MHFEEVQETSGSIHTELLAIVLALAMLPLLRFPPCEGTPVIDINCNKSSGCNEFRLPLISVNVTGCYIRNPVLSI